MTIIVTGATGYIGREFVKAYSGKYNIIVLIRQSSSISLLESLNCNIISFEDFDEIESFFSEYSIDGVVHFASSVIVEHKIQDINTLLDSNIKYGTYLLEACKKHDVKWFINTGTFWQNFESKGYNPVNLYAATKEAFQDISKFYTQTSNLIFTTIKLNDTFGPNDTRAKIFNLWDEYSRTGKTLDMSKGEQIIDISYIEDIVSAFNIMIENLQRHEKMTYNNNCYIVSSNQRMPLKDLANLFENITGRKLNVNWGDRPYRNREVMTPYESGLLVPNWRQRYTLEKAIIKTIGDN